MICGQCDKDLEECTCPDLEERFKKLNGSPYLHIGPEYQCRILANIEAQKKNKKQEEQLSQQIEIGVCDGCNAKIPMPCLKTFDVPQVVVGISFCRSCYESTVGRNKKAPAFFAGKTARQLARLRSSLPPFPEKQSTLPTEHPHWACEFADWCARKANWYGYKDAFEFFGKCLKE